MPSKGWVVVLILEMDSWVKRCPSGVPCDSFAIKVLELLEGVGDNSEVVENRANRISCEVEGGELGKVFQVVDVLLFAEVISADI